MPSIVPVVSFLLLATATLAAASPSPDVVSPSASEGPANISADKRNSPMVIRVMRDARPGCGSECGEWIAMEGKIDQGAAQQFFRVVHDLGDKHLPVFIDSGGGIVEDALAIGRMIRDRHLDVAVTQTIPNCPTCDDHSAYPKPDQAICASACVMILAAGENRLVAPSSLVGVHQMSVHGTVTKVRRVFRVYYRSYGGRRREVGRRLVSVQPLAVQSYTAPASEETNEKVAAYFDEMGMQPGLMPLMLSTPPTSIRWLTRSEEHDNSLVTRDEGGTSVIAKADVPQAPVPPVAVATPSWRPADAASLSIVSGANPSLESAKVAWHLEQVAGEPDAIVADVDVPGSKLALSLRLAPDPSSPKRGLVADVSVRTTDGGSPASIHKVERISPLKTQTPQGAKELTGRPHLVGSMAWQLVQRPGMPLVDPRAHGRIALRLVLDGGRVADLTFDQRGLDALYEQASRGWAAGHGGDSPQGSPWIRASVSPRTPV